MSVRPITRRDKNFSVKTDKEIRRPAASRPPAVKGARRRITSALRRAPKFSTLKVPAPARRSSLPTPKRAAKWERGSLINSPTLGEFLGRPSLAEIYHRVACTERGRRRAPSAHSVAASRGPDQIGKHHRDMAALRGIN